MEQILQSQWKAAGFELKVNNTKSGTLFGEWLPKGTYQIAIYAQTPTDPDPGQCVNFCSKNIPGPANKDSGQNYTRINDPQLDKIWLEVDTLTDDAKRLTLVQQGYDQLAELVPAIPVDPFPKVLVYNTAKLHGPVSDNPIFGMWWNMNMWFCDKGVC
jgi:peptide/nickel transport system substrate-binding protein